MSDQEAHEYYVFAYDPGEVRNGFAWFEVTDGIVNLKQKVIITSDGLYKHLEDFESFVKAVKVPVRAVVVENYRVRNTPGNSGRYGRSKSADSYGWKEVQTIRRIGAFEYHAHRMRTPIVIQEPKILDMGRRWVDFPIPKSPNSHPPDDISAYIHGAQFLMNVGVIRSVDEIIKFGQPTLMQVERQNKKRDITNPT